MSRDQADKLAAQVAATVEYVGGPWCGQTRYVTGPVKWMSCWQESEGVIHVWKLGRDQFGRAAYFYEGIAHAED